MTTRLAWLPQRAASCWHAVAALAAGRLLVDDALVAQLSAPAAELSAQLADAGVEPRDFFAHLVPLSLGVTSPRELTLLALTKCLGRERAALLAEPLAPVLGTVRRTYDVARPALDDDLALRGGPLSEQWQARGAGLLLAVRRLTERELLPDEARVVLVEPVLGGGGAAFSPYNVVTFEALLANPIPQLPEVLRLAWLVAQLNLDLPRYADRLPRARLSRAGELALVPLVLAAADDVELARLDRAMIEAAISTWRPPGADGVAVAATVDEWWQVYHESRPELPHALVALDQMLGAPD